MATENTNQLNQCIDKLAETTDIDIKDFASYLQAIQKRHDYFHEIGCRISDHGIETAYAQDYTDSEIKSIFDKIRLKKELTTIEQQKFKSAMMVEFAVLDHSKGWVMQLHLGLYEITIQGCLIL